MTRVTWDDANRFYSEGISNGMLYPQNSPGVSWSGLISVSSKSSDSMTPMYMDGIKYTDLDNQDSFSGTISAYTYPDEFQQFIGRVSGVTAQSKPLFGFSYITNREIHIVYNALAEPSSDQYSTIGDQVDPVAFAWNFTTLPVEITHSKATSHLVVALDYAASEAIADLQNMIWGSDTDNAFLPTPDQVIEVFETYVTLRITDNGDGTWTAEGPGSVVHFLDPDTFQIDWPSAEFIDADTYRVYSL